MPVLTKTVVDNTNYGTLSEYADTLADWNTRVNSDVAWEDDPKRKAVLKEQAREIDRAYGHILDAVEALRQAEKLSYDLLYRRYV